MSKLYIPFGKPNFSDEEIEAVTRVMRTGWIGMGSETIAFENDLAKSISAPHVVAVNSCTSALFLSLIVSGISPGDEVICPSLTWCSTANAILYLGATPVFCDIDPDTLCITPESVTAKITKKTRAVMVVHFGGLSADIEEIKQALPDGVKIIEDAAHAMGALYQNGEPVGSSGNLVCFSFYANKNLSTGEGGAVGLFDEESEKQIRSLRQHALPLDAWKRFTHAQSLLLSNELTDLGYKMNYTDLNAAIGRVQLKRFSEFTKRRKQIAQIYVENLDGFLPGLTFQKDCIEQKHARHLFIIKLPLGNKKISRNEVLLALRQLNIGASLHYTPLHTMPLYQTDSREVSRLPVTEQVGDSIMTLPISASISVEDAYSVVESFKEVVS